MTVGWIAERLAMGTRGYLNHLLYRRRKLGGEYTISRTDPFATFGEYTISRTDPFANFRTGEILPPARPNDEEIELIRKEPPPPNVTSMPQPAGHDDQSGK